MPDRLIYLARHGHAEQDGPLSDAGRQQSDLLGQRLRDVPLSAVHYSPLERAAQTAELVTWHLAGVPSQPSELVGDYPPPAGGDDLPTAFAAFVGSFSAAERERGAALAAAAIDTFARPAEQDGCELIITHNFLIGWFIRHAMRAPDWRWMGLNQCNGALTAIRYSSASPPALVIFNDMGHLPAQLRWTGFDARLRA